MKKMFVILVSIFVFCTKICICADESNIDFPKFLRDASAGWQMLSDEYEKGLDTTLIYKVQQNPGREMRVCIKGSNELNQYQLVTKSDVQEIFDIVNSKYGFTLKKSGADAVVVLSDLVNDPKKVRENHQFHHGLLAVSTFAFVPIMIEDEWIESLVRSKDFTVNSLKKIGDKVVLDFRSQHFVDTYQKITEGTIVFDPEKFWVIREYDVEIRLVAEQLPKLKMSGDDVVRVKKTIEYQFIKAYPFPSKVRTEYKSIIKTIPSTPDTSSVTVEYGTTLLGSDVPDIIFYLSHYGFAEPSATEGSYVYRIRLSIMLLGLILIALGIYLRIKCPKN
jgi:hypothetical protein